MGEVEVGLGGIFLEDWDWGDDGVLRVGGGDK